MRVGNGKLPRSSINVWSQKVTGVILGWVSTNIRPKNSRGDPQSCCGNFGMAVPYYVGLCGGCPWLMEYAKRAQRTHRHHHPPLPPPPTPNVSAAILAAIMVGRKKLDDKAVGAVVGWPLLFLVCFLWYLCIWLCRKVLDATFRIFSCGMSLLFIFSFFLHDLYFLVQV